MAKFVTLANSCLQILIGGVVLALGLIWPILSAAQNKSNQVNDSNPHAQHQEKQPAGNQGAGDQMPGMKMPGMSGQKPDSAWWYDNYTRNQKPEMGGRMGMPKSTMDASSMAGDGSSSRMRMMDDVDLMGMMDDEPSMMGTLAIGGAGLNHLTGPSEIKKASSRPGTPGISRLYHIGATGFFLNHSEHSPLTTKQQATLNRLKQKAQLSKFTALRKIEEAEQELWELTGADEPDASKIQAQVQAIEKLGGEQRIAFIRSVGEAVKLLTDEQRRMLLGTADSDAAVGR